MAYEVDDLIPDYFLKRSLKFKTAVIIIGAVLLLVSSFIRQSFTVVWVVPFLAGALVEWFVVATVYVEMSKIEGRISRTQKEIQSTADEIKGIRREVNETRREVQETQGEVQETQQDINQTKEDVFSFMSDSQGNRARDSLEDRLSEVEGEVGTGMSTQSRLSDRVSELERKFKDIGRGRF